MDIKVWVWNADSVADPGFPRGGGANPPGRRVSTYDFAKCSQKLHEIERIWTGGGGGTRFSRPLRSATVESITFLPITEDTRAFLLTTVKNTNIFATTEADSGMVLWSINILIDAGRSSSSSQMLFKVSYWPTQWFSVSVWP